MKTIDLAIATSTVSGIVTGIDQEGFLSYLNEHLEEDVIRDFSLWVKKQGIVELAILKNLYVDSSSRGKGFGTKLLDRFIQQVGSYHIILIVDNLESQVEGFSLEKWYQQWGFEYTGFKTLSGPIMVKRN